MTFNGPCNEQQSKVFWPRWYVRYSNGYGFPPHPTGPQCGLIPLSKCHGGAHDVFRCETDIMFINNYVFKHSENPEATIGYYVTDETLPTSLTLVKHVAIHASCLSMEVGPEDHAWGRHLRFILCNFPAIETITLVATTVLDTSIPTPSTRPRLAYEILSIDAVSPGDRARLGILDDPENVRIAAASGMAADSVIQSWDDLGDRWPSWRRRQQEANIMSSGGFRGATGTLPPAPELCLMGVIFFAREWVDVDKDGEHGRSCELVEEHLGKHPVVRAAVRREGKKLKADLATAGQGGSMRGTRRPKACHEHSTRNLRASTRGRRGERRDVGFYLDAQRRCRWQEVRGPWRRGYQ